MKKKTYWFIEPIHNEHKSCICIKGNEVFTSDLKHPNALTFDTEDKAYTARTELGFFSFRAREYFKETGEYIAIPFPPRYLQCQNPITKNWVKIDTFTGNLEHNENMWPNVPFAEIKE